jgi:hypothetical protein
MRTIAKKQYGLIIALCLGLVGMGWAAKAIKKPHLRFPFGLTPESTPASAKPLLESKGLVFQFDKTVAPLLFSSWALSGQMDYDQFMPRQALITYKEGKLSSIAMNVGPIRECGEAQPVFVAALDLVRTSYDSKDAPVTAEPATNTLDCGPYFKTESYILSLESKKMVCTVVPTRDSNGFRITLTYLLRPDKSSTDEESPNSPERKHLKDNL